MKRRLKPIEIAEGALLVDMAVVFQLLAVYLPIGSGFFRLLVFIVFTVLVLRRGMYTGILAMWVALFLCAVMMGPQTIFLMLLQCMGGLFLGVTMRSRLPHLLLILLGVTCGALAFCSLVILLTIATGGSIDLLVRGLHRSYDTMLPLVGAIVTKVGLGAFWQQQVLPVITIIANFAFTYWLLAIYGAIWVLLCPVVTVIYMTTNLFVRLMGYDVRPFPGGRVDRLVRRGVRRLVRLGLRMGLTRKVLRVRI